MANANKPSGFTPVKYINGADWDGKVRTYYIDSTDGNTYFVGDPVNLATGLDTKRGLQTITRATVGSNPIVGILVAVGSIPFGPFIDPTNLTLVSAPASKTQSYYAAVVDDPQVIFEVQEGGTGYTSANALTAAAANKNGAFFFAAPAAGVAVSGCTLDCVTNVPATTATFQLKLLGLSQRADNVLGGGFSKWLCKINNHPYCGGTGALGY